MNERSPCIRVNESEAIRARLKEVFNESRSENRTCVSLSENLAGTDDRCEVRIENLSGNLARKNLNLELSREPVIGRSVQ